MKRQREIWLVMARTGGDYEYTDWPIDWRFTEGAAEERVEALTKRLKRLVDSVPPCPAVGDPEPVWDDYLAREKAARTKAEKLGLGLHASLFTARVVASA